MIKNGIYCIFTIFIIFAISIPSYANRAYEHVMETGIIRCGFASWEPILIIDPNTRQISGIAHDVIEEAAKILGLEVKWTEESNWGEFVASLSNHRFDVFCAGPTPNTERARELLFTDPFVFTPFALYTEKDDNRFDYNSEIINNSSTTIAVLDGTTSLKVLRESFPEAKQISYPESVIFSQLLVEVANNKVDLTMQPVFSGHLYKEKNPGHLKAIPGFENFRVLGNLFMLDNEEFKLRELLNAAIDELRVAGKLDQIIEKYEPGPGVFYRIAPPYKISSNQ